MSTPPDRCEQERKAALRERQRRSEAKYRATEKGKRVTAARNKRWRKTEQGRASLRAAAARYRATPKGRNNRSRIQGAYSTTSKGKATTRRAALLARYGITEAQYAMMVELQGGVCAICGRPPKTLRLAVEHDHQTGRVRGLACFRCNRDRIGANTVETARKVLAYLESDFDGRKLVA